MTSSSPTHHWVITLACADQPGIVHAVSGAIVAAHGNIVESQQFSSDDTGRFFMRLQVESPAGQGEIETVLEPVIARYAMEAVVDRVGRPLRTLVLASSAAHCVNDLLFRQRGGQLPIEIPLVLSIEAVDELDIELVVLARYMQILSPELCDRLAGRAINIHHSFLPGFKGASPYRQAHARGVKLIGATAHFVTGELDEGPIIEQNVVRVDHSRTPAELVAIGQDEESRTLTTAVKWFAENRVLLDGIRTIIFK